MKLVKVQIELVVDEDATDPYDIAIYLTDKLYNDPEWFGDFGPENIMEVKDFE
jgi:hypothetical protein